MAGSSRRSYLYSVGIDLYDEYRTLAFCCADATALTALVGDKLPALQATVLHSGGESPEAPVKASVEALLGQAAKLDLGEPDLVMFYFAGHGFSAKGLDYLVCKDTRRGDQDAAVETAIPTDHVVASLRRSGAGTGVLIVDACRDLAERDGGMFGQRTAEMARRQGVIVLFACSPGEVAQELPIVGHGVFTDALIKAVLEDHAHTPLELDRAILGRVNGLCSEHKLRPQKPYTALAPLQKATLDIFTGQIGATAQTAPRRCIVVVGPPNAGKTSVGQFLASRLGYVHMEMSAVAWQHLQDHKRNQPSFSGSIQDFMEHVFWPNRQRDGIAQDLLASAKSADTPVVICGPRTVEEIETLRAESWDCLSLYLFANERTRYERYAAIAPADRYQLTYPELVRRDLREYSWGLAKAGHMSGIDLLVNEGTLEELFAEVEQRVAQWNT